MLQVKYAFLKHRQQVGDFGKEQHLNIRTAAKLLQISVSGYDRWQQSDPDHPYSAIHSESKLIALVKDIIRTAGKQVPRLMRIYLALRAQGVQICFKHLRRLLRENGIFHRFHHKYVATTESDHNLNRMPNLVNRHFNEFGINQAWCGDITYIPTDEGWLYLASVLDLGSRCLVGYSFAARMTTSLIEDAITKAIENEKTEDWFTFP